MRGVILYGPPASGKDTITAELVRLDPRYRLYRRLKVGSGRTAGYRMATEGQVDALRRAGEVIWENRRYGATYVVDRSALVDLLAAGLVPIVHLGQAPAVQALTTAVPSASWLRVHLWCPRDVAAARIAQRGTGDTAARLHAWDETEPLAGADLALNTAELLPHEAAATVHARLDTPPKLATSTGYTGQAP